MDKPKQTAVQAFDDGGWDDDDWNLDDDFDAKAKKKAEESYDDKFDDPDYQKGIDIKSKAYQNENLNKLSDEELARRKRQMDKDFDKNFLKPGDAGFVYDKVVDFNNQANDSGDNYSDDWN